MIITYNILYQITKFSPLPTIVHHIFTIPETKMSQAQGKLRFAVVCASNMNRSMEAHNFLSKKGYNIQSYGTGHMIKIPGKSEREPNAYPFGTTYDFIFEDLKNKDLELYTKNGMLHIMERNRRIKVSWLALVIRNYKLFLFLVRTRKVPGLPERV